MTEQPPAEIADAAQNDAGGRMVAGAVLIFAGLGLLALQFFEGLSDAVILFFVGVPFIAGYLIRKVYGLLVAGSIIVGVGLGQLGEEVLDVSGDITVIGIGIGFVMIYVIDRLYTGSSHFWPLIPGGILLIIGLGSIGGSFADVLAVAWPALLIVAGLTLLIGANRRRA